MDKFNLDVSLVARVGGHSAPRTYRDPHLCFDSDGEEDCRKVRQGENDHQSTGDGVRLVNFVDDRNLCLLFCVKYDSYLITGFVVQSAHFQKLPLPVLFFGRSFSIR